MQKKLRLVWFRKNTLQILSRPIQLYLNQESNTDAERQQYTKTSDAEDEKEEFLRFFDKPEGKTSSVFNNQLNHRG